MEYRFGAIIVSDGKMFGVFFPDLPGCVTIGETRELATERAVEALSRTGNGELEHGKKVRAGSLEVASRRPT